MATEEKTMQYANFNITFGSKEEPMLAHFEDIILPAFLSGYRRGKQDEYPAFYFNDVKIKEINGEYTLVGNCIKETQYSVHTTVEAGELVSTPAEIPTAPYSRFIIFLNNHRMILVRNEQNSPNVRSFQATVRGMLNNYIRKHNREAEKKDQLPKANANVIDIPLKRDIMEVLKDVHKINSLKLRFVPLNNDMNPRFFAQGIDEEMKRIQSKSTHVQFTSPGSTKETVELIEETSGLAAATLNVLDADGNKTTIREDQFSTNKKVYFGGDLGPRDDEYFVRKAKEDETIKTLSDANKRLYDRFVDTIKRLID